MLNEKMKLHRRKKNEMNLADAAFSGLAALLGGDNSGNLCRDGILAV